MRHITMISRATQRHLALGFTLLELMVVIVLAGVLVALAAPSVYEMILMQRLRGTHAQLVTDLQQIRAEAAARRLIGRVSVQQDSNQTCYVLYVTDVDAPDYRCACLTSDPGLECQSSGVKILRTVNLPRSSGVTLDFVTSIGDAGNVNFGYDPVTGGLLSTPNDAAATPLASVQVDARIDDNRRLRTTVYQTGRLTVCAPDAGRMQVVAC
jgi:type IV fimbrial biogenesis protein FimT